MSIAILNNAEIDHWIDDTKESERFFIGSDEYLDAILEIQKKINTLINSTAHINDLIESSFNDLNEENAKDVIPKLIQGVSNLRQLLAHIKRSHRSIVASLKTCTRDLVVELEQTEEFIKDIVTYKINSDSQFPDLLKDIN